MKLSRWGTTINSSFSLHGLIKDSLEERIIRFPFIKAGSLTLNDLYVSTACHSLLIGSALLIHASLIIDAPKKHFVFLPHQGKQKITVGNKDVNGHTIIPTEAGDPNGVLTVVVREGSTAASQQKSKLFCTRLAPFLCSYLSVFRYLTRHKND